MTAPSNQKEKQMYPPGVLIDASIPRQPRHRCEVLFDYLVNISKVGPHGDLDPFRVPSGSDAQVDWSQLETNIINRINEQLPSKLVCKLGEPNPGDVVVEEWEGFDPCDCGEVRGERGLYVLHAPGKHPDCHYATFSERDFDELGMKLDADAVQAPGQEKS